MVRSAHLTPPARLARIKIQGCALRTVPLTAALAAALTLAAQAPPPVPALLDPAAWDAVPADGVEMHLASATGPDGAPALRIDYDFHGHAGWAAARRRIDLELPAHYELRFLLRGEGPANNLEVKLVDPSGDNVWWHVDRDLQWPAAWTPVRIRQRQISFAWGPLGGGEPRRIGALELTVSASSGGRGTLWVAGLAIVPVEPPPPVTAPLRAEATSVENSHPASDAVDGDERTSWRPADGGPAALVVDLGGLRDLGGLTLAWLGASAPRHVFVELSSDGREWNGGREVIRHRGTAALRAAPLRTHLRLPDAEARFVRVRLPEGAGCPCALAELVVRPLAFGASPNDFFTAIAREAPRGAFPRGLTEAAYWTVVGLAGEAQEVLFSEDGAIETRQRGFSLEPLLYLDDHLVTWAEVTTEQALADGDLPIPTVTWKVVAPSARSGARTAPAGDVEPPAGAPPLARLEITALAAGEGGEATETSGASGASGTSGATGSTLLVRYRLVNESSRRLRGHLFVAARPFQVNPPYQFLNLAGGVAPLRQATCADGLRVESEQRVIASPEPRCGVLAFDDGLLVDALAAGELPGEPEVDDPTAAASAVLAWEVDIAPGAETVVVLAAPLAGDSGAVVEGGAQGGAGEPRQALALDGGAAFTPLEATARQRWRATLDRVALDVPPEAAPLVRTLRSNLAFIEIHRDGPALQPGSRAYARSWIRDGALTGVALLRLGHGQTAARFAEWFAGFQYPDGKVPCCVDRRGADPVPENDSHGELVHLVAETWRYGRDRALAERLFPRVERAVDAIETLRQQRRTPAYRTPEKLAFFGLLPESISHEGYSAKPVHSYWDDTFAYRGLDDAVTLAAALGHRKLAATWARRRDELRADLQVSIARVREKHDLDYLPASVELADFDSTSTTTMLDPGGLLAYLPLDTVEATFERFWREHTARRVGGKEWEAYTPYEVRHVGAFVRLAMATGDPRWKERAHELLAWYLRDQRPPAWNGWPEAVHRGYREPRFLGDLPHGWVGSDFIRSLLDLFAYERSEDRALVLGAGIPVAWLERPQGVSVSNLGTPWGPLSYTLAARPGRYRFTVAGGLEVPSGGIVLAPPTAAPAQPAQIDGRPASVAADGTVVIRRLPAVVDFLGPTERPARLGERRPPARRPR